GATLKLLVISATRSAILLSSLRPIALPLRATPSAPTAHPPLLCEEGNTRLHRPAAFSRRLARDDRLRRRQSRDRHTIRRTTHIVESHLITKLDRGGIAAVLTANSDFELRTSGPPFLYTSPHKSADTIAV